MKQTTENTTTHATTAPAFADLLRAYETAVQTDGDTAPALLALATAVAHSVLKKCIDPQRKTAPEKDTASNNGISPALVAVKRGIVADLATLDKLTTASNKATALQFNKDGDLVSVVVDADADKAVTHLLGETLSEGIDLVNTAVVAILEEMQKPVLEPEEWEDTPNIKTRFDAHMWATQSDPYYAEMNPLFLETPYKTRRICRKVYIKEDDTAKWETVETTPIQEVYRAVRREIQNSRAVQTDPRNGYLYIEDTTADPDSDKTETIYRRLQKWADLGGYTHDGYYTADPQTLADYETIVSRLNLTERQAQVLALRMRGYGYQAIATYLGVSKNGGVYNVLLKIREKCEKLGFTPAMWAEMVTE